MNERDQTEHSTGSTSKATFPSELRTVVPAPNRATPTPVPPERVYPGTPLRWIALGAAVATFLTGLAALIWTSL